MKAITSLKHKNQIKEITKIASLNVITIRGHNP